MWAYQYNDANNDNEISFLDVKELYEAAYVSQDDASLLAKAEKMDMAYRAQLKRMQEKRYEGHITITTAKAA